VRSKSLTDVAITRQQVERAQQAADEAQAKLDATNAALEVARLNYLGQVGFTLDVDYSPNDAFRVVQLTPPGSGCSIQIGRGLTDAPVGSLRNIYLVVTDIEAACNRLLEHGVEVGEIRHKVPPGIKPAALFLLAFDSRSAFGLNSEVGSLCSNIFSKS
jgi:hypothetical protein